ncbi:MAG TPA: hypothetical protein VN026_04635 [Bacteroidia bacterium]|jgi:hypothetical protein|nr:hypothetical protein [Bacteroidia bacterium]
MSFLPRTWQIIQNYIKKNVANDPTLSTQLTSTSPVSHWQLWSFQMALTSNLNEQAASVFIDEVETIIAQGAPQTALWIQAQILLFQYNVNTPYLIGINNYIPSYQNVVPADRIISNCAVVVNGNGLIFIKVTQGSPASQLTANQSRALKSYLTNFLSPNQAYNIISTTADQLWIKGTIYYNGQLNASIQGAVISALNIYITQFSTSQATGGSFNGLVKVTDIAKIIEGVIGVVDWVPAQITITPSIGSPTNLILANNQLGRSYITYSGYVKEDAVNTFLTQLTFIPANN